MYYLRWQLYKLKIISTIKHLLSHRPMHLADPNLINTKINTAWENDSNNV